MRKKANKSFREYVIKWREQAAQVKPPLDEQELVDIFIEAQNPNYFYHLTATIGRTFHTLIKIGEMVESGLKTGMIVSQASIKANTQVIQGGPRGFGNCKRKDISISIRGLQCLVIFSSSQSPLFSGPNSRKPSPTTTTLSGPIQLSPYAKLCSRSGTKNEIHSIGRVISSLFQKLRKIGVIKSIPPHYLNLNAPGFQANDILGMICDDQEYKLLGKMVKLFSKIGEEDKSIKSLEPVTSLSVEGLNLDTKVLCVFGVSKRLEVRSGMPMLYVSKGFSLTQQDQSCVAKLKEPILVKPVQQLPVTNPKVVPWNYNKIVVFYRGKEIVEEVDEARGLTRSGRCYSPKELRKGKMAQDIQVPLKKILNEAHVSKETTVNQLEKMANRIFESNTITFTDDELPTEGAGHNRALHLTVKCEGHYVNRVIIDGGSGPWIQMAQAVPSTLHQVVNFEYDHQEIIVHGEDDLSIYRDPSIPYMEANEACASVVYKSFEIVSVDRFKERDPIVQPCLSSSSSMVATTMLKYGYQPGLEIEASFTHEDIIEVIQDPSQLFCEVNMVQVGEGTSHADVHLVGSSVELNNWEATHFPTRKKSW
ncbi:hypothetical protein KY284_022295 [Solanum tuberosum]|nr:hypothetical protein KY284_022295 [Solanum tuberosum]